MARLGQIVREESSFAVLIVVFCLLVRAIIIGYCWYEATLHSIPTAPGEQVVVVAASVEMWREYIEVGFDFSSRTRFLVTADGERVPRGMRNAVVHDLIWNQLGGEAQAGKSEIKGNVTFSDELLCDAASITGPGATLDRHVLTRA